MKFTENINNAKFNCEITIRLDDEYGKGHEDFSITATFWEVGKPRIDRYHITSGCCHDEILKVRPQYKPFINLHLCDFKGAPLYAVVNGLYYAEELRQTGYKVMPSGLAQYFRITQSQAVMLCKVSGKYFAKKIKKMGIDIQWQNEANEAIKLLESLTGEKFKSNATKSHFQH